MCQQNPQLADPPGERLRTAASSGAHIVRHDVSRANCALRRARLQPCESHQCPQPVWRRDQLLVQREVNGGGNVEGSDGSGVEIEVISVKD